MTHTPLECQEYVGGIIFFRRVSFFDSVFLSFGQLVFSGRWKPLPKGERLT